MLRDHYGMPLVQTEKILTRQVAKATATELDLRILGLIPSNPALADAHTAQEDQRPRTPSESGTWHAARLGRRQRGVW